MIYLNLIKVYLIIFCFAFSVVSQASDGPSEIEDCTKQSLVTEFVEELEKDEENLHYKFDILKIIESIAFNLPAGNQDYPDKSFLEIHQELHVRYAASINMISHEIPPELLEKICQKPCLTCQTPHVCNDKIESIKQKSNKIISESLYYKKGDKNLESNPPIVFSNSQLDLIASLSLKVIDYLPEGSTLVTLGRSPLTIHHALKGYLKTQSQNKKVTLKHIHFSGSPDFVKIFEHDSTKTYAEFLEFYLSTLKRELITPNMLRHYHKYLETVFEDELPKKLFILDTVRSGVSMLSFLKVLKSFCLTKKKTIPEIEIMNTFPIVEPIFNSFFYTLKPQKEVEHKDGTKTMVFDSKSIFGPDIPVVRMKELVPYTTIFDSSHSSSEVKPSAIMDKIKRHFKRFTEIELQDFKIDLIPDGKINEEQYLEYDRLSETELNLSGGVYYPSFRWDPRFDFLFQQDSHPAAYPQMLCLKEAVNRMQGHKVPTLAFLSLNVISQDAALSEQMLEELPKVKVRDFFKPKT